MSFLNLFDIVSSISHVFLNGIFFQYRFLPVYFIIALFMKTKYDRYTGFHNGIYGPPPKTGRRVLEEMILTGLLSGFALSFLSVGMGITISVQAFQYMLIIMAVLAMINTRYVCISYAGGLLCIASLVFGISEVNVSGMIALIAVLHFLESFLIYMNAGRDSIPVFIKTGDGIAGAFLIHKFWPVPVIFLVAAARTTGTGLPFLPAGGHWPLFGPEAMYAGAMALMLDCVITGLYYTDIAITRAPEQRGRETAFQLLCYSVVLLFIAYISGGIPALQWLGAVFAVLAHEGITLFGHYRERTGEPMFKPARRGLRVLDFLPKSHARKMGMQKGDVILSVNGRDIQTEEGVNGALKDFPTFVWICVAAPDGKEKTYEYKCFPEGLNRLGIITVPREREVTYNIDYLGNMTILKDLVTKFRNMNKPV